MIIRVMVVVVPIMIVVQMVVIVVMHKNASGGSPGDRRHNQGQQSSLEPFAPKAVCRRARPVEPK